MISNGLHLSDGWIGVRTGRIGTCDSRNFLGNAPEGRGVSRASEDKGFSPRTPHGGTKIMKFDKKKLGLNRETLRNLSNDQLDRVAGGRVLIDASAGDGGAGGGRRNPCTDATPVTCVILPRTFAGDTCNCTVFAPGCD
jgi:hypothetical protein